MNNSRNPTNGTAPEPTPNRPRFGIRRPTFLTQSQRQFPPWVPEFIKQMPALRMPPPKPDFKLIPEDKLAAIIQGADEATAKKIMEDITFLDKEVLRYFRERDYAAATQQNRYRLYQILYIGLATAATLVGALQAQFLAGHANLIPFLAAVETTIALLATFLSAIAGREPPLPLWLKNRRRAESLRREYFRFLMDMPPYDTLEGFHRRTLLSQRAADINRGVFPDETEAH